MRVREGAARAREDAKKRNSLLFAISLAFFSTSFLTTKQKKNYTKQNHKTAVIKEFGKSIGVDTKQVQGLIRLAKKNGEKLGFLA